MIPTAYLEKLVLPLSEPAAPVLAHLEQYLLKEASYSHKDYLCEMRLFPNNCMAKSCDWEACACKQSQSSA